MKDLTAGQLRARLGEALDLASAGERIVIKRDHRPIAAIIPIEDVQHLEGRGPEALARKRAAMRRIRERAERMTVDPSTERSTADAAEVVRWERDHGHEDGA